MAKTTNRSMQEDKKSERKGQGDGTSKDWTAEREKKGIIVGFFPFLVFLVLVNLAWTSSVPL